VYGFEFSVLSFPTNIVYGIGVYACTFVLSLGLLFKDYVLWIGQYVGASGWHYALCTHSWTLRYISMNRLKPSTGYRMPLLTCHTFSARALVHLNMPWKNGIQWKLFTFFCSDYEDKMSIPLQRWRFKRLPLQWYGCSVKSLSCFGELVC
jgi:hypothetical protein